MCAQQGISGRPHHMYVLLHKETVCVFIVIAMIDLDTASDCALQVLHKETHQQQCAAKAPRKQEFNAQCFNMRWGGVKIASVCLAEWRCDKSFRRGFIFAVCARVVRKVNG